MKLTCQAQTPSKPLRRTKPASPAPVTQGLDLRDHLRAICVRASRCLCRDCCEGHRAAPSLQQTKKMRSFLMTSKRVIRLMTTTPSSSTRHPDYFCLKLYLYPVFCISHLIQPLHRLNTTHFQHIPRSTLSQSFRTSHHACHSDPRHPQLRLPSQRSQILHLCSPQVQWHPKSHQSLSPRC